MGEPMPRYTVKGNLSQGPRARVMVRVAGALVAVALSAGTAAADYKDNLERAAGSIKQTPPRKGVEQAPAASGARPGWCGPPPSEPFTGGFDGHLKDYYQDQSKPDYKLLGAAVALCRNDTAQPVIKLATREIVQLWMNANGLSAADAVESIKFAADDDARKAGEQKACDALALDPEIGGTDRAFLATKRDLFGCSVNVSDSLVRGGSMEMAVPWLDGTTKPIDELVRLAFVYTQATSMAKGFTHSGDYATKSLLHYVTSQFDFRALDAKAALQAVDSDPLLKGNAWAKNIVKNRIGHARLALLTVEEEVAKKTEKSAEWREILITAPQRGHKDFLAATAKYKAELQRSAEVEGRLFGPSRKAMAGCKKTLEADLAAILKPMKRETAEDLIAAINVNPVAGLLFRRFQACVAVDGHVDAAREMMNLQKIRVLRGPRTAAYFAALDAIATIRADRDSFPVHEGLVPFTRDTILHDLTYKLLKGGNQNGFHDSSEQGVIKSMKKGTGGTRLEFAKDKQERWSQSCTLTKRIVTYEHDGDPVYMPSCKGKVVKLDVSPNPVVVPDTLAAGLAPGRMVSFGISDINDRIAMPFEVYKDKKGKNLVAWMTIGL